jgi:GH24 family phage-related lysozyme (muramidase)
VEEVQRAGPLTFEESLRLVLEADEGIVHEIYEDHLGNETCGIGHFLVPQDREYGWPVGTKISEARVTQLYNQDITIALNDARSLHPDFDDLPDPARIVIASLSFQLGLPRYKKFKLHHAAIEAKDWREAAAQLRDSSLYRQTTKRTERHAKRLESLA